MSDNSTNQPSNESTTPAPAETDPNATQHAQIQEGGSDRQGTVEYWKAEAEKWKGLSRKHETNWEKATKELGKYEQANMTDAERAIAEAKEAARQELLASITPERVQDKLEAAAAKAGVDLAPLLPHLDTSKFATPDGGVDQTAIGEFITQVSAQFSGQKEPRFAQGLGIGPQSDQRNPGQLTRADIQRMSPREVAKAKAEGRLDALMRGEI